MAVHVGSIAIPGSTGNHDVTGLPFEPVAVLFFGGAQDLGTPTNYLGCATADDEQWVMWTAINQEVVTYDERVRALRDDRCITALSDSSFGTVVIDASFVGFLSDGFTLNWSTVGSAVNVSYMALGGRNISAAHAGIFTVGSSTGTTAVTAPGFEPRALVVAHILATPVNTQFDHAAWGLGFSDGTNSYSSFALARFQSVTAGNHIHRTDAIACGTFTGSGDYRLELDSFDANGFTVDVTDAWPANNDHGYLAIDCTIAQVGNALVPDSTGTQTYATPGFKPAGVLFGWNGADTPSTTGATTMPVRPGVGATDGLDDPADILDRVDVAVSFIHRASAPAGAYVPDAFLDDDLAINISGQGSQVDPGAVDLISGAVWDAFNQGEFVLDWTTTTTNDRHFGWLALPGDLEVNWIPHIYRRVR